MASLFAVRVSATAHQTVVGTVKAARNGFEAVGVVGSLGETAHGLVLLRGSLNRELDGVGSSLGSQVVHARLEALLPAIEVHQG